MIPKPDVVRIVYAPPETPATRVQYSASQAASIVTPTRKRRRFILPAVNTVQKRHSQASLTAAYAEPPPTITPDESQPENDMGYTNTSFNPREPSINESIGGASLGGAEFRAGRQPDERLNLDEAKFMFFVEAVSSDQCSFLQLTEELFISNDWNMEKDEAFVSALVPFYFHY